jgi:flagellar assembly protein FliH
MADVIRHPRMGAEPLLLRTGLAELGPAAAFARDAEAPAGTQSPMAFATSTAALSIDPLAVGHQFVSPPPGGLLAVVPSTAPERRLAPLEAELRERLAAEREQVLAQTTEAAHTAGYASGYEAGHAAGHEAGLAAGQAAGQADWADRSTRLDALLASIQAQLVEGVTGHEDLMVELAFEAVVRILGQAAPTAQGVRGLVREAIGALRDREQVRVRLAPPDAELLRAMRGELAGLAGSTGLEIVADETIELGGCLLETARGGLDARLETQMQRLRELLLAARSTPAGDA